MYGIICTSKHSAEFWASFNFKYQIWVFVTQLLVLILDKAWRHVQNTEKEKCKQNILRFDSKDTIYFIIFYQLKVQRINFIFFPAFYLIICLMKATKNFEKIAILKIWEPIFYCGVKIHFGKLPLEMTHLNLDLTYFMC